MPDVTVEELSVRFGSTEAVRRVTLRVPSDRITVILGPSGSGKSTLLRSVAGLVEPTTGTIRVGDRVMFDASRRLNVPPEQRQLGMVFQSHALWPHMNVLENVMFPLRQRRVDRAEAHVRAARVLNMVGLEGFETRYPGQLSGGESQRVSLARALVYEPLVLLFDEPLSSLDAPIRAQMRREIRSMQEGLQTTMVYVTHDRAEAEELADTLVVMRRGAIEEIGQADQVLTRPASPFTADFLLDAIIVRGRCTEGAFEPAGSTLRIPFANGITPTHLSVEEGLFGIARTGFEMRTSQDGPAKVAARKHSQGFFQYSLALEDGVGPWDVLSNDEFEVGDRLCLAVRGERIFALRREHA